MGAFAQPIKLEKTRAHDSGTAWLELSKREVILGIDSASSNDLYGIGIFALETETEAPYITTLAIAPPLTVQTVPYIANAVDNGEVTTTHQSNEMLDIERVEDYLYTVIEKLNVVAIYYDPHGLKTTASKLLNRYPSISVNYVTQGYVQLSPAIQYLQEQIEASQGVDKRIEIDLKGVQERFWHNLNVEFNKEGLMKPIKTKSDNFIDPPASLITAVAGHLNYIWVKANKRPKRDLSKVTALPIVSW
jgi:phage terminase large subunit-like protein